MTINHHKDETGVIVPRSSSPATVADAERAAFEACASVRGYIRTAPGCEYDYVDSITQARWEGWQARARLAALASVPAQVGNDAGVRKARDLMPKLQSLFNRLRNPESIRIKSEDDSRLIGDASDLCRTIINAFDTAPQPTAAQAAPDDSADTAAHDKADYAVHAWASKHSINLSSTAMRELVRIAAGAPAETVKADAVHFVQHDTGKPCNEWSEISADRFQVFTDGGFKIRTLYAAPQIGATTTPATAPDVAKDASDLKTIDLGHGANLQRQAKTTGEVTWLMYNEHGLVRSLSVSEIQLVQATIAALQPAAPAAEGGAA